MQFLQPLVQHINSVSHSESRSLTSFKIPDGILSAGAFRTLTSVGTKRCCSGDKHSGF